MKNINIKIVLFVFIATMFSCEDVLVIDPFQSIDSTELITDASSAGVAMNGLYSNVQDLWGGTGTITIDILSDITDWVGTFPSWRDIDENNILPDNTGIDDIWNAAYVLIYNANVIIDVIPTVTDAALDANRAQYLGEARAVRAWAYYYLTNLWGDVPLITAPVKELADVNVAATSQSEIYSFIAGELNSIVGDVASGSATRVSKGAINAMLARVYLSQGNWSAASSSADAVMSEGYQLATNYMDLFNGSISNEAIFQLDFNSTDQNSLSFYYWDKPGGRHECAPSESIVSSYEAGDARRASVGDATSGNSPYYTTKYIDFATGSDKPILLRLADIMLVKAEALAETGDYAGASAMVNQVRTRAGLADVTLDASNFKDIILHERKVELAWEGGNRWFDMLRTNMATDFVTAKGQESCKILLPVIRAEIDANTAISQNPCY